MECTKHTKRTRATVEKIFPNGDKIKKCTKCGKLFRIAKNSKR